MLYKFSETIDRGESSYSCELFIIAETVEEAWKIALQNYSTDAERNDVYQEGKDGIEVLKYVVIWPGEDPETTMEIEETPTLYVRGFGDINIAKVIDLLKSIDVDLKPGEFVKKDVIQ